jgi:RNA polymerase sigma-70 factor (ECF subfamily)
LSPEEEDDRRLVDRVIRQRDERAFGALYDRHTTYLYRLALRLTGGDELEANDLVHDAWVRATERLSTFQWKAQLRTWLAGFVINAARERRRAEPDDVPLDAVIVADSEPPLAGGFDRVDLERALSALAPGFRQVLVLHDVEGYTHEEIGRLLGIEPGTSKSQLSRARAAMRRLLGEATARSTRD